MACSILFFSHRILRCPAKPSLPNWFRIPVSNPVKPQCFSRLGWILNSSHCLANCSNISLSKLISTWISKKSSPPDYAKDNHIHETLAPTYLFHFLRTGDPDCWAFIANLIAECDSKRASKALLAQLHSCRGGGWLTAGGGVKHHAYADDARARTWDFFSRLLADAQTKLQLHREAWDKFRKQDQTDKEAVKQVEEKMKRTLHLVDGVAMQLFFASGAFDEKSNKDKVALTWTQLYRFWNEAAPLFNALVTEPHPHTAHQIVQNLYHLLPCSPAEVFLLATKSIRNSAKEARFQYESLAVGDVVKFIQRAFADHRDIFKSEAGKESECFTALLEVLDLFVEAGWPEARQLTHRLEEIYR